MTMTSTGRLSRVLSPRWFTSSRGSELNADASLEGIADRRPPIGIIALQQTSAGDSTTIHTQSVNKLRDIILNGVVRVGKQMRSGQSSGYRKSVDQSHSVTSGQGFVEAMSECHSSVDQYYGLGPRLENTTTVSEPSAVSVTTPLTDKQMSATACKSARINEAKKSRISASDTRRRMRALTVNVLAPSISVVSRMTRLRELCNHARQHPASRVEAINRGVIPFLLSLQAENERLKVRGLADSKKLCGIISESLSVLGHSRALTSRGIKILSIDGGGTRGLVAIETLKQLEIQCGAPIHQLFDYICGVSTGGLLAVLVGPMKMSLDRCEAVYKECSQRIFNVGKVAGAANLVTRLCYYDMSVWEGMLKDEIGEDRSLLSTARDRHSPRIGLVSTIMTNVPRNYVFRNYNHGLASVSQYSGSCDANVWEAIRASAAAPGYFEDFKLGEDIHQDGGVLNNNPTAIAIHEAKALWPEEQVQCIVSVGNGRYEPDSADKLQDVRSLRHKVGTFIHSATNTEGVHTVLNDLLPAEIYYRFNPYMSEEFLLNEIQEEKLQQMQFDTQLYLRRNASKINKVGQRLSLTRTPQQRLHGWVTDKYTRLFSRRKAAQL